MKSLKSRILAVLLACTAVFGMTACGSDSNSSSSGSVISSSVSRSDSSSSDSSADSSEAGDSSSSSESSADSKTESNSGSDSSESSSDSKKDSSSSSSDSKSDSSSSDSKSNSSSSSSSSSGNGNSNNNNANNDVPPEKADEISSNSFIEDGEKVITDGTLVIDSVEAKAGDTVNINVSIKDNPGLAAGKYEVDYDSNVMKVIDNGYDKGDLIADEAMVFVGNTKQYPNIVVWTGSQDILGDGVIMTMTIKISDNAKAGEYPITILSDSLEMINAKQEKMLPDIEAGKITIK